jgi:hypothetical protein
MSFTIKVANFPGRNAGEQVAWVVVDAGTCPGAKRGQAGAGINPKLVLGILGDDPSSDTDHQSHLREVCLKAIALTQPAPASPLARKAVANATADMFYVWDGESVLDLMSRSEAMAYVGNELAMFSVPSDKENWKSAAEIGLTASNVPSPPSRPSAPSKPEVTSGSTVGAKLKDSEAILAQINAARGQRVLSSKAS